MTAAEAAPTPASEAGPIAAPSIAAGSACTPCLRRGELLGRLAPRVAGMLARRRDRPSGLLELPDRELVMALAPREAPGLMRWLDELDPVSVRRRIATAGLGCVCRHSPGYPTDLLRLPDPPAALYVRGGSDRLLRLAEEPAATIVGGRSASPHALDVAVQLGRELSSAGVTVVSGLALGVDAAAHRGAVAGGGRAIAVLASGADLPSPQRNRALYQQLVSAGCVVSELPPGTEATRWAFPARNRIMAALGRVTVVVEAAKDSGSLITATFAEDLGRDVAAVPGLVTSRHAAGSNGLLRDGARVVRDAEDVLEELFGVGQAPTRERLGPPLEATVDPATRRVLEAVEAGHRVDAIGAAASLPAAAVRAALGRLEVLGLVRRDQLGLYERAAG